VLPQLAQRLGDVLPLTYAVAAIREAWTGGTLDAGAFAVLMHDGPRRHGRSAVVPMGLAVGGAVPLSLPLPGSRSTSAVAPVDEPDAADRLMPVWHALLACTLGFPTVVALTSGDLSPRDRLLVLGLVACFALVHWAVVARHPQWWQSRLLPLAAYWVVACTLVVLLVRLEDSYTVVLYGAVPLMFITLGWWASCPIVGLTGLIGLASAAGARGRPGWGTCCSPRRWPSSSAASSRRSPRRASSAATPSPRWRPPGRSWPRTPGTQASWRSGSGSRGSCTTPSRSPSRAS
jgi:hypothetical protein